MTLDGQAWLKEGKTIGTAYVGIVQNLAHSDRAAVYRHGGDPNGEITAEHHLAQGNKWDAGQGSRGGRQERDGAADVRALLLAAQQHRRQNTESNEG